MIKQDEVDLALLMIAGRCDVAADLVAEIIRECPTLSDELSMACARLRALSAEFEQVLMGDVNRARTRHHNTSLAG